MTTVELDSAIKALRDQKAGLQTDLTATQERNTKLGRSKDSIRTSALRQGESAAKTQLNKIRQDIAVCAMTASDITEELLKVDAELSELLAARAEARKLESWEEFLALSETVTNEAMNLDVLVAEFFQSLQPHCAMLARMNDLLTQAGMEAKRFSMVDFQRFFDVRANAEFGKFFGHHGRIFKKGSAYEQDYSAIVETRVKHLKMRHDGVPVPEIEERVPKMVIAINE